MEGEQQSRGAGTSRGITRRRFLAGTSAGVGLAVLGGGPKGRAWAQEAGGPEEVVRLPSAAEVRTDYQTMVDFGPRLPGYEGHDRFVTWLEEEFVAAGLQLLPCDQYEIDRWQPQAVGLEVLEGEDPGPITVAQPYVRAASTGPDGVVGPLVYGGPLPSLSFNAHDPSTLVAAFEQYPQEVESWAAGLPSLLGGSVEGAILVVDLPAPPPLTMLAAAPMHTYLHWPGHTLADWAQIDFKRLWLGPWPSLEPFAEMGAAGVILVADASFDALDGNYSLHYSRPHPVPGLVVDRDTGQTLRTQAGDRPETRLTLDAPIEKTPIRSVTAVLPGESDEVVVVASHSDGQNVFEENGAVALVHMARHFASLPPGQRLERTLVFAAWPGHMTGEHHVEEADGWIAAHKDLLDRMVAAVHLEHLGAPEWIDTPDGYVGTGENEVHAIWTTQGTMQDLTQAALIEADLYRHALLRPPLMITPGRPFHFAGVPFVGGISGPVYLLVVSENGEMDKLDAELAARQTAFYADVVRRIDSVPADELASGDPTLGQNPPAPPEGHYPYLGHYDPEDVSTPVACGPDAAEAPAPPGSGGAGGANSNGGAAASDGSLPETGGSGGSALAGLAAMAGSGLLALRNGPNEDE